MTEPQNDPYIGEVFEDRDYRMHGRRIRILRAKGWRYEAEVILAPASPWTVGRTTTLHPGTITKRYRKVSH